MERDVWLVFEKRLLSKWKAVVEAVLLEFLLYKYELGVMKMC